MTEEKGTKNNEWGSRFSISLEVAEPVKKDDGWDVFAGATVFYKKRYAPRPPQEVVFVANENEVDRVPTDDESGRVSSTLIFPAAGGYLLTVFLASEPAVRATRRINIKLDKPKKPAKIISHETYSKGGCALTFQVLTEDNLPVSGAILKISDQTGNRSSRNLPPTDSKGVTQRRIRFKPKEKEVFLKIMVLGSEISIWKNLFNDNEGGETDGRVQC